MASKGTSAPEIFSALIIGGDPVPGTKVTLLAVGTITVANGATTGAATVTGLTTSAKVLATLNSATNAVYVVKAVPTANTVTVTVSGDPGAATGVASFIAIETA